MSDTPKTDELAKREFVADGVWIRHARELERENAALRQDKERLGWLLSSPTMRMRAAKRSANKLLNSPTTERHAGLKEVLRAGIDAARKEAP